MQALRTRQAADVVGDSPSLSGAQLLDGVLSQRAIRAVFQPLVNLDSGATIAYEALSRGPQGHPLERPDRLFAAAREAGRLAELDWLCRWTAVTSARRAGLRRPWWLTVNVEPETLGQPPPAALATLRDDVADDVHVVVELTERQLTARPAELLASLARIRALGWGVALDDVGADPASLALMPLVQPDLIKLDLRLVQQRPTRAIAQIVSAVNAEAERSGARVLAEGIETPEHLDVARSLGATIGQGWLFGRPAPLPTPLPPEPREALVVRPLTASDSGHTTPFRLAAGELRTRLAHKSLLVELSQHLEREAMIVGDSAMVLSTFQQAANFTADTQRRYRELADAVAFVAALGEGMTYEAVPDVRGAALAKDDPVRGEWDIVVLSPHFAAALLARDLGDTGHDAERRFEFGLTYNRRLVAAAAESLMARLHADAVASRP